jgi:uncharacterized membrane protein
MKSESKRTYARQLTKIGLIITVLLITVNIGADQTDPYTVYGTVKDENGIAGIEAIITVENLNTNEISSNGEDTITGSPIPITIDSNGVYTFDLKNLNNGYRVGDEIKVTAEKDGMIGSKSAVVDVGTWGGKVDVSMGTEEVQAKESWFGGIPNLWLLHIILFVIICVIIILLMLKRKKGNGSKPEHGKNTFEGDDKQNEVTKEEHNTQDFNDEEAMVYKCPECDNEINAQDIKCSNCGVMFENMEEQHPVSA